MKPANESPQSATGQSFEAVMEERALSSMTVVENVP